MQSFIFRTQTERNRSGEHHRANLFSGLMKHVLRRALVERIRAAEELFLVAVDERQGRLPAF